MRRPTSLRYLARLILFVWGLKLVNVGVARARRRNDPAALGRWVRFGHWLCDGFDPAADRTARAAGALGTETPGGCASQPDRDRTA